MCAKVPIAVSRFLMTSNYNMCVGSVALLKCLKNIVKCLNHLIFRKNVLIACLDDVVDR